MTVSLKDKREINKFIELLAFSTVKSFYPTAVLKYSQVDSLESIFDFLLRCVEDGELKLIWEVKCANEDQICARKIRKVEHKHQVINDEVMCDICGFEFKVTDSDLFPTFEITNEYRELLREDLKKKEGLFSNKLELKKAVRELVKVVQDDNTTPKLSYGNLDVGTQLKIDRVDNLQVIVSGDGIMDQKDRSISVSGNVSDNVNLNNGDNVTQTNNKVMDDGSQKYFADLLAEISTKVNGIEKDHLEFFAEKLKEAYEKNDKEEGSKIINFLKGSLGHVGSLASIASLFGLSL